MIITNVRDALLEAKPLNNLGRIPNPEEFSRQVTGQTFTLDTYIGDPRCPDLSIVPQQFHAVALMACKSHLDKLGENAGQHGTIVISQAEIGRGENLRVTERHIDAIVQAYPETPYETQDVYIVSDTLPTQFYTKPILLPEELPVPFGNDPRMLSEHYGSVLKNHFNLNLEQEDFVTPSPYELMNYNSFVVHQAQLATEPTHRTMCLLNIR